MRSKNFASTTLAALVLAVLSVGAASHAAAQTATQERDQDRDRIVQPAPEGQATQGGQQKRIQKRERLHRKDMQRQTSPNGTELMPRNGGGGDGGKGR